MKYNFPVLTLLIALLLSCTSSPESQSPFTFTKSDQGVELLENEHPVFFYRRTPKSLTGEYICNNYIHPLYSLDGDTLTEEFPVDHAYHRGIFWAWHQHYICEQSIGDGWIMKDVSYNVVDVQTKADKTSAPVFRVGHPF